jgi:hypothetical protein
LARRQRPVSSRREREYTAAPGTPPLPLMEGAAREAVVRRVVVVERHC